MGQTQAPPDADTQLERWSAWGMYRQAINDGWGATCRLCLILLFRWGVPVSWVYSQAETGKLPAFKLGKYLRFRPAEVTAWLEAHRLQARNQEGR